MLIHVAFLHTKPSLISLNHTLNLKRENKALFGLKKCRRINKVVDKDSEFEVDPDEAREALRKLDQQLQSLSSKQVSSPKIRAPNYNKLSSQIQEEGSEISGYDSETEYFDEVVKKKERRHLFLNLLKDVSPGHYKTVGYYRTEAFRSFETQFEEVLCKLGTRLGELQQCCEREFDERCSDAAIEQADWDTTIVQNELLRDIETHALPQLEFIFREQVCRELTEKLDGMFHGVDDIIEWASVRKIIKEKSDALYSALVVFKLNQPTLQRVVNKLMQYAKEVVEMKFTKELQEKGAFKLMMERFLVVLAQNSTTDEKPKEDKRSRRNTKDEAYRKRLKLLSIMEVIRLDEIEVTLITPTERDEVLVKFSKKIDELCIKAEYVEEECKDNDVPLSFWAKLGLLAMDVLEFIAFFSMHRLELAVPLLNKIVTHGVELASAEDFRKIIKHGWKKTKKEISKMMTSLKEAFKKFLDFMKGILTKRQCSTTY